MLDAEAYSAKVTATATFLKARLPLPPELVVITGTGQDLLPAELTSDGALDYAEIPNFPVATAPGHRGQLIHGRLAGRPCLFLQGRAHCYEGYDTRTITLPIRACAVLGAKILLITNTAGGLNPAFRAGDLMLISDHLNFLGENPLQGPNHEAWGPRFPDLSRVYSERIMAIARAAALNLKIQLVSGVYAAVPGPSLETPAETRFLRNAGADAVGMSTVPEVIVATHAGLEVFGLSLIANANDPDCMQPIRPDEVIAQVKKAAESARRLLAAILSRI